MVQHFFIFFGGGGVLNPEVLDNNHCVDLAGRYLKKSPMQKGSVTSLKNFVTNCLLDCMTVSE